MVRPLVRACAPSWRESGVTACIGAPMIGRKRLAPDAEGCSAAVRDGGGCCRMLAGCNQSTCPGGGPEEVGEAWPASIASARSPRRFVGDGRLSNPEDGAL